MFSSAVRGASRGALRGASSSIVFKATQHGVDAARSGVWSLTLLPPSPWSASAYTIPLANASPSRHLTTTKASLFSTSRSAQDQSSSQSHPPSINTGVKSTLPSSTPPVSAYHAFKNLKAAQQEEINDGDRGYLAFTKASLFKLTFPLYPPDDVHDPHSPTSKASSARGRAILAKTAEANPDEQHDTIPSEPWEERVEQGERVSQVGSPSNSAHVQRKGKNGVTIGDTSIGLHGPEHGEPSDNESAEFDAQAPARSVVFLLHSGQPLSYIASLIKAERPSFSPQGQSSEQTEQDHSLPSEHHEPAITFHTRIGDGKRWSPATGIGDFLRDAARIGSFVIKVGEREVRISVPSFEERTRFLRATLYGKTARIERMAKLKLECDKLAHTGTRRVAVAGAGVLAVWWTFVTYATFFTSLGWDVMEPATYLVGLGTLMAGYSWFLVHNREVSYRTVLNETTTKRQQRLYVEKGFNVERYQELIDEVKQLRSAIKLVAEDYDLEWDQGDTASGKQHRKALDVVRKAEARDESKGSKRRDEDEDEDDGDDDGGSASTASKSSPPSKKSSSSSGGRQDKSATANMSAAGPLNFASWTFTLRSSRPFAASARLGLASDPFHVARLATRSFSTASTPRSRHSGRDFQLPDDWEAVIGVECHAQIKGPTKLFSPTPLPTLQSEHNTLASPFDASHPGTLPQLQMGAVAAALRAALFLNCRIQPVSTFDRKHYFYPDLTPGYQITQKYTPLAVEGYVDLRHDEGHLPEDAPEVRVQIEQLQLEQDTAKSSRMAYGSSEVSATFVDLNRAGSGLMEIVSGPQLRTAAQAGAYIRKLQELLRRVGASDGNMEEGSLRCDVNVSVHRIGEPLGTRCEVKNVNGVRFVMNAITHEVARQYALLAQGQEVTQQTRGYDVASGETVFLRSKEDAPDYRYMPDPNLPPIRVDEDVLNEYRNKLPEHPDVQRTRLQEQYGLKIRDVNVLMRIGLEDDRDFRRRVSPSGLDEAEAHAGAVAYFEAVSRGRSPHTVIKWVVHSLMTALNQHSLAFSASIVPPKVLGELIDLVEAGKLTQTSGRAILSELVAGALPATAGDESMPLLNASSSTPVLDLATAKGLLALEADSSGGSGGGAGSEGSLDSLCAEIVRDMPEEAEKVRKGQEKVVKALIGAVMRRTKGRADARAARDIFVAMLRPGDSPSS